MVYEMFRLIINSIIDVESRGGFAINIGVFVNCNNFPLFYLEDYFGAKY